MAIPTFDDPKEGSFATSKVLTLNGRLNFSNFFMAYLFSYFKSSFTTCTSKVTTNVTPMVVIVVGDFMKCKLWATLWNSPCNLPWLPPYACFVSFLISSFWNFIGLFLLCHRPHALENNLVIGLLKGKTHLAFPLLFFWFISNLKDVISKLCALNLTSLHCEWYQ